MQQTFYKNILIFGISDNPGGIETYVLNMLNVIDTSVVHFDILSVFRNIVFFDEFKNKNCKVYTINSFLSNPFKHKKQLEELIKNNNYDAIYLNVMDAGTYFTAKICKNLGLKIITHSHNSNTNRIFLHNLLKKKLSKISDIKLACSSEAGRFFFDDDNFIVVPNAISFTKYQFNEKNKFDIRNNFNIKNDDIVFCHVGRIVDQKNPLFLINLFYLLYKKYQNIYLIYIGDGILKNTILNKIQQYNSLSVDFDKHIKMIGALHSSEISKYLSASDVFLLPSKYEGLPISLIEAEVNGLVCFCSNNVSKEVNIHNVTFLDLEYDLWINSIEKFLNSNVNKREYIIDINNKFNLDSTYYKNLVYNIFKK